MGENIDLEDQAKEVLEINFRGDHTVPTEGLYPHQWLWDSCFIAIGLRHYDIERAQTELRSLVDAQWENGMVPHMVFARSNGYYAEKAWDSFRSPHAPNHVRTSGVTQPPMLAEAVVAVGEKLSDEERIEWYKDMYPHILSYHQWLYDERDPRGEGLVTVLHSWESGMDNTPPWMTQLAQRNRPRRISVAEKLGLEPLLDRRRAKKDGQHVPHQQRLNSFDMARVRHGAKELGRKRYDSASVMNSNEFILQDLAFNAILIRANTHLASIAEALDEQLPPRLAHSMKQAEHALEWLWDPEDKQYYSRVTRSGKKVKQPTVSNFLPLYSGALEEERIETLVDSLNDYENFGTEYPIPTVPVSSPKFEPERYWQGPSWVNMNWLVIDGLRRNHQEKVADELTARTLETVNDAGFYEYFNPITGEGAGARNFSWTASLVIDLLNRQDSP